MTDENLAQRHRHGKAWRDSNGDIVEPLIARGWGWVLGGLGVLVTVLVLLTLFARAAAQ